MTCSINHHLLKKSNAQWGLLTSIGEFHDDENGTHLEMRLCPECGSSLARPLPGHVSDEDLAKAMYRRMRDLWDRMSDKERVAVEGFVVAHDHEGATELLRLLARKYPVN